MEKGIIIYLILQLILCGFAMFIMEQEINNKQSGGGMVDANRVCNWI